MKNTYYLLVDSSADNFNRRLLEQEAKGYRVDPTTFRTEHTGAGHVIVYLVLMYRLQPVSFGS